ncbi:MAG: DUF192 domain-containing protein [Bacteriovoracaceae bacterium]
MRKVLILFMLFSLLACQSESRERSKIQESLKEVHLVTASGKSILTKLAISLKEQQQGLSGIKPEDYPDDEGLLFFYLEDGERNFWMPDTYFDIDLIYLDKDLKVLDIIRKLPHHIGRINTSLIPRARPVWCRHTLEMKAGSAISAEIKIGEKLEWKSELSLAETEKLIQNSQNL